MQSALFLFVLGADPVPPPPAPKQIVAAAVDKLDKTVSPPWVEIVADPILTTLAVPAAAKWILVDDGCELRPATDGKTAIFAATKQGRYRLVVIPDAGDPIRVAVVVGKVDPPAPVPPPVPVPVDPLVKKFQALYDADVRAADKKKSDLADLVELYRQAGDLANSADVTTSGQLVTRVREAAKALGVVGLEDLRRAVSVELATAMPNDVEMTVELRKTARDVFLKIRSALQEVK
jgi:hypothetical protein